ncbi:MAG: hypothetical protein ACREDP_15855, partial [Bradyrhizobium sp.]
DQGLGARVISMSASDMLKFTGGKATPLAMAWSAYGDLLESPVVFDRKAPASVQYAQIAASCARLGRDFDDASKWVH